MEIEASDLKNIKELIDTWWNGPDVEAGPVVELESSFGRQGMVDVESFIRVAKRLSALEYEQLKSTERLNIILPSQVRFSLENTGSIQDYCRDDIVFGKEPIVIKKDHSPTPRSDNILLHEYDVLIKARRELPIAYSDDKIEDCAQELQKIFSDWQNQLKAFRLIKRWSFEKDGVRFDLSMVRSTKKVKEIIFDKKTGKEKEKKKYKYVKTFKEENIMENEPTYEIEVELIKGYFTGLGKDETASKDIALKRLSGAIGVVLKGLQNNGILIKRSNIGAVINSYKSCIGSDIPQFRGVAPITMSVENMKMEVDPTVTSIRANYNVTDKADGLRVHGFTDKKGELYMIDMNMRVYKTNIINSSIAESLVDGEWVTTSKDKKTLNNLYIFDIYYYKGSDVSQKPFNDLEKKTGRYYHMGEWIDAINIDSPSRNTIKGGLKIFIKKFYFHNPQINKSIFTSANFILEKQDEFIYETDGLIFTPNLKPLPSKAGDIFMEQFKWKPARENTIDFLVKFEKDDMGTEVLNTDIENQTRKYKTMRLYVSSNKSPEWSNPRATILNEIAIPSTKDTSFKPAIFNPIDFPDTMASVCYIDVEQDMSSGEYYGKTHDSDEPIRDMSIIEMSYDPTQSPGWRWKPLVVRSDKTAKFMTGIIRKTMNTQFNANIIWNSIHNPITDSMIKTGSERPSEEEQLEIIKMTSGNQVSKVYYERKASTEDLNRVKGLRDFHKDYIKEKILYSVLKKTSADEYTTLIDTSVGRAADIHRWIRGGVNFILGVDVAGDNILEADGGAYARYMDIIKYTRDKSAKIPPMIFAIGDSSKRLVDGSAGATPEEADILRAVFGLHDVKGVVPKFVESNGLGRLRSGAHIVTCMFALHYFLQTRETWEGYIKNLDETLKVGGYFIGACFDGDKLFNELRGKKKGDKIIGVDGDVEVWSIAKDYSDSDYDLSLQTNATDRFYGKGIDVNFISIGTEHKEYLVSFTFVQAKLKELGIELLTEEEYTTLGLPGSTQLFNETYNLAETNGKKYVMSDAVKKFSFFNRWFIFKRKMKPELVAVENIVKANTIERVRKCDPSFKVSFESDLEDNKWLDMNTHFPIPDSDDPSKIYPSIKYYMIAMRFKIGMGDLKKAKLFEIHRDVHEKFLGMMQQVKTPSEKAEVSKAESAKLDAYAKQTVGKIDDVAWNNAKDDLLKHALRIRYEKDAKFRKIVDGLKNLNKYILYHVKSATNELGGICLVDGTIKGENKYGKFIMDLAGYSA